MQFHENPPSGSRVYGGRTVGRTEYGDDDTSIQFSQSFVLNAPVPVQTYIEQFHVYSKYKSKHLYYRPM
jgi:hypothetical protein